MTKIQRMHKNYGRISRLCRDCMHCACYVYECANHYKCEAYGVTHSDETDWDITYSACGLFNREHQGKPLAGDDELTPDGVIKGQVTMEDLLK